MLARDIQKYLSSHLPKPSHNPDLKEHELKELHTLIVQNYDIKKLENSLELYEAFEDFFESVGSVHLHIDEEILEYSVVAFGVSVNQSESLPKLLDIIEIHHDLIEYPYMGRNDQIYVPKKMVQLFYDAFEKLHEDVDKKATIRQALRISFNLSSLDIILIKSKQIYIKIFETVKNLNPDVSAPNPKKDSESRFNGYDEKGLSDHYKVFFDTFECENFLCTTMSNVFKKYLNFDKISYQYFDKNALKIIRLQLAKELKKELNNNEDYILGFAGYIFRRHFLEIYELIVDEILTLISKGSTNAQRHLQYHTGIKVILDKKKYKMPELTTKDNKVLTYQHANTIAINYHLNYKKRNNKLLDLKKNEALIKRLEPQLHELDTLIDTLEDDVDKDKEVLSQYKEDIFEINQELKLLGNRIEKEFEINELLAERKELSREEDSFMKQYSIKRNEYEQKKKEYNHLYNRLNKLDEEALRLKEDISYYTRIINTIEPSYFELVDAFILALISPKELIRE